MGEVKLLNPALHDALSAILGEVRVTCAGEQAVWHREWDNEKRKMVPRIVSGGEQYYVCCPVCGDTRWRLSIGHRLLTYLDRNSSTEPIRHAYKCQNEGCRFDKHPSFERVHRYIKEHPDLVGFAVSRMTRTGAPSSESTSGGATQDLPGGTISLSQLPAFHPARQFVLQKYGFDPDYLSEVFRVGFCVNPDPKYPAALNRIIFPIAQDGKWVSWQGRSIDPMSTQRWYFPSGFRKVLYNWDTLPKQRGEVLVITEGIPAAIASGPLATAIFGKDLDPRRIDRVVRNFRTAIIATDPETMIPDPTTRRKKGVRYDPSDAGRVFAQELKDRLDKAGLHTPAMLIRYPPEVMQCAREAAMQRKNELDGVIAKLDKSQRIKVPDPADIGANGMRDLLRSMPPSHRSVYFG